MSEKTNQLLQLFSKLLSYPNWIFALRTEQISKKMNRVGDRNGAQGLLVKLWKKDGLTNAEIAELLDIRPSSVTAQVKNLEEKEMIVRRQDEQDKRVSRIFLTEKGKKAGQERFEIQDELSENIFGQLTEEEQATLTQLLQKLIDGSEQQNVDFEDFFGHVQGIRIDSHIPKSMKDRGIETWVSRCKSEDNPFAFRDGMHQFRDMNKHNPWNFGQNGHKPKNNEKSSENDWQDF